MPGSVLVRTACFVMLAACGALCQQREEKAISLPDAPTVQASAQTNFSNNVRFGQSVFPSQSVFQEENWERNSPRDFITRHLYPTLPKQNFSQRTANESLARRATYAASRTLITRNTSGKAKLNTSYLLRTLTAVAKDTASTPYWRRKAAEPFSDFGATIGNDVGTNVWHEFEPAVENLLKNHTPRFVMAIEGHGRHK